ncbi:MAG: type VI secretion system protein TssA [Candidatus Latescibacterota bacterium]
MSIKDLGSLPIPGDNPAGVDVSFEPEFEAIEAELQKLSSPTSSGGVDWEKIAKLGEEILGRKSKHLLVAGYLNLALFKTSGLRGLAEGVHALREMLETYWETMYPPKKRMRGRANAVAWWSEKVDAGIAGITVEKWPLDVYNTFAADLEAIDSFLGENLESAPILRSLNERILSCIEPEEPKPEITPPDPDSTAPDPSAARAESAGERPRPASPQAKPESPSGSAALSTIDFAETDFNKLFDQGLQAFQRAASLLANQDRFHPLVYRLTRIGAWLSVQNLPSSSGGRTMIPQPDDTVADILKNLYQARNWDALLDAAESRVSQFIFWLDLSRYASESLAGLGHPEAAELIAAETADYVRRLPGIENLAFSEGLPFADSMTRDWLKENAVKGGGGNVLGGDSVEEAVSRAFGEAQKLMGENRLDSALTGFREKRDRSASARERFIWTAGFCRLLMSAGKTRLMLPYIREILGMLDTHQAEHWEPGPAAEGLSVALAGLRLQEPRDEELIENVLSRLAAVNPARALEFLE